MNERNASYLVSDSLSLLAEKLRRRLHRAMRKPLNARPIASQNIHTSATQS